MQGRSGFLLSDSNLNKEDGLCWEGDEHQTNLNKEDGLRWEGDEHQTNMMFKGIFAPSGALENFS